MVSFIKTIVFSLVVAAISAGVYFANLKKFEWWDGIMAYIPIAVGAVIILLALVVWKKSGKKK
jgi:hypothetical protein